MYKTFVRFPKSCKQRKLWLFLPHNLYSYKVQRLLQGWQLDLKGTQQCHDCGFGLRLDCVNCQKMCIVHSSHYRWKDVFKELWTRLWHKKIFGWFKHGRNWLQWKMENKQACKQASKMIILKYHNSHIS